MTSRRTAASQLASAAAADGDELALEDGSRIAVIGGGPAGSFFAYLVRRLAADIDLDVDIDIFEPRSFRHCGPGGCNHCGGIVSESLVQILAAEGIRLPEGVVQRGIESYVVHMDVGKVALASPSGERRIAALYRGNGPRNGELADWESFDGFLQRLAVESGARVVPKLVHGIDWVEGIPHVRTAPGQSEPYDLVCLSAGVNSNLLAALVDAQPQAAAAPSGAPGSARLAKPETTRTYICEFRAGRERIAETLGDSMHVFLLDIPRLEFAAFIPKGDFVTMCMLGDDLDQELVSEFLASPVVRACFPVDEVPCVCTCSPLINVRGMERPFADRLVLIGDAGVTRLYKDGIGASFRTAKAAAAAVVYEGISAAALERSYLPACRAIAKDNDIGRILFAVTTFFKHARFSRRAILRMASLEQARPSGPRRLSSVLWNMFTGSAPYREIFVGTLHPAFIGGMLWNLGLGLASGLGGRKGAS